MRWVAVPSTGLRSRDGSRLDVRSAYFFYHGFADASSCVKGRVPFGRITHASSLHSYVAWASREIQIHRWLLKCVLR